MLYLSFYTSKHVESYARRKDDDERAKSYVYLAACHDLARFLFFFSLNARLTLSVFASEHIGTSASRDMPMQLTKVKLL